MAEEIRLGGRADGFRKLWTTATTVPGHSYGYRVELDVSNRDAGHSDHGFMWLKTSAPEQKLHLLCVAGTDRKEHHCVFELGSQGNQWLQLVSRLSLETGLVAEAGFRASRNPPAPRLRDCPRQATTLTATEDKGSEAWKRCRGDVGVLVRVDTIDDMP